jgi:hypothetical protein
MSGHKTRRRRGHPKGKAYGFHGLRPASSKQSTKSSDGTGTGSNSASTPTSTSGTSS